LIESCFGKLKERLIWRSEFETLDEARDAIGAYIGATPTAPTRPGSRSKPQPWLEAWTTRPISRTGEVQMSWDPYENLPPALLERFPVGDTELRSRDV
jgi:hypothetical protein